MRLSVRVLADALVLRLNPQLPAGLWLTVDTPEEWGGIALFMNGDEGSWGGSGITNMDEAVDDPRGCNRWQTVAQVSPRRPSRVARSFEAGPDNREVLIFGPHIEGDSDLVTYRTGRGRPASGEKAPSTPLTEPPDCWKVGRHPPNYPAVPS
jgi:hypothetical protein